jgi:hypothetical protein
MTMKFRHNIVMSKKNNWGLLAFLGGILIHREITKQGEAKGSTRKSA